MMLSSAATESSVLLAQLVMTAARTLALAAGAGLLLTVLRVKAASARLLTWTAVLYAGLTIPLLAWLLPPIVIPVPFLPSARAILAPARERAAIPARSPVHNSKPEAKSAVPSGAGKIPLVPNPQTSGGRLSFWLSSMTSIPWTRFAALTYFVVALWLFSRILVGLVFAHRLVRSSPPIQDSRLTLRLSSGAHAAGERVPRVHESPRVSVPITIGVLAPRILLPADWHEWDKSKLDAVILHELSHVARHDGLSQFLALVHRALFWFSPLAWWLNRHLVELAEEVSDEAALASGAERNGYAAALLEFLEAVHGAEGRIHWQGVAIASRGQAEVRLRKILAWRGAKPMRWTKSAVVMFTALATFALYVAAAARPVAQDHVSQEKNNKNQQVAPAPPETPVVPSAPVSPPASLPSGPEPPSNGTSSNGPAAVEPAAPAAPPSPVDPEGYHYAYGFDDEQRFVIVSGKMRGFTMSGTSEDARHAEKLRNRISGDFIWFQRDEKSYIIRDPATIERARQLWAPQEELGKKQEELGKQQEALGKQQEELGARMEQVRVKVPDLTAELDKLKAEWQQLGTSATAEQIGKLQSEMAELQSKIAEVQAHAGADQAELGSKMGELGEKQGRLGQQQGELGRQQGELAQKATRAMKELLDDAIKKGIAQPEGDEKDGASL